MKDMVAEGTYKAYSHWNVLRSAVVDSAREYLANVSSDQSRSELEAMLIAEARAKQEFEKSFFRESGRTNAVFA